MDLFLRNAGPDANLNIADYADMWNCFALPYAAGTKPLARRTLRVTSLRG